MNKNFVVIMLGTFILGMAVIFGTVIIGKVSPETNRESRFEDRQHDNRVMSNSFNISDGRGSIVEIIKQTKHASQVRVKMYPHDNERYAVAIGTVTNGQYVLLLQVNAQWHPLAMNGDQQMLLALPAPTGTN